MAESQEPVPITMREKEEEISPLQNLNILLLFILHVPLLYGPVVK